MKPLTQLSDDTLIAQVKRLVQCERQATATLVAHLAEFDDRRLFLSEGCPSMFNYCTRVLHLSEHAAYLRIKAVRAIRRFPVILEALANGELNLTSIRLLALHLTAENFNAVLAAARHGSRKQIELIVASLQPLPDVPSRVRKLPNRAIAPSPPQPAGPVFAEPSLEGPVVSAASPFAPVAPVTTPSAAQVATPLCAAPSRPSEIRPLAPERFKVQFTASASLHDKLRRAQDLLRHRIPSGDLSQVFELALNTLIERLDREKFAATDRPRVGRGITPGSRAIPAEVKRAVWKRDDGRCAFVGKDRRCNETGFLEFHHVVPFGRDGEATVENIALRCWAHNQYEAVLDFGPRDLGRSIEMEGPPRAP